MESFYQRTGLPNYYKEVYLLKDGDKMVLKASGNPFSKSLSNLDGAKVVSLQDAQNIIDNDTGNKIAKTSKWFMQDKYIYIPEDIISKSLRNIKPKAKKTA